MARLNLFCEGSDKLPTADGWQQPKAPTRRAAFSNAATTTALEVPSPQILVAFQRLCLDSPTEVIDLSRIYLSGNLQNIAGIRRILQIAKGLGWEQPIGDGRPFLNALKGIGLTSVSLILRGVALQRVAYSAKDYRLARRSISQTNSL